MNESRVASTEYRVLPAFVVALLLCAASSATSVRPIAIEDMAQRASNVVEGRAEQQWSVWDTNEHLIYTYTRFAVSSTLKGRAHNEVVVRQIGGSVNGVRQHASGVRQFVLGEEAALFLRASTAGDGSYSVVGLMQGSFRIRRDGGEARVSNDVGEATSFEHGRTTAFTGAELSLHELEQRVHKAAGQ